MIAGDHVQGLDLSNLGQRARGKPEGKRLMQKVSNRFRVKALAACALAGGTWSLGLSTVGADPEPTRVEFDPENFVDPTTSANPYHPTRPGIQWVRAGTTQIGGRKVPEQVTSTMTDVVRMIDGVPAVAMLDSSIDAGEITQVGFDYFAVDKDNNLWLMGGYTENYEGGEYTDYEDCWLGTTTGGLTGILVPGVVTMDTPRWFIGTPDPEEESISVAEPVAVGVTIAVPFGEFNDVIAIREGAYSDIDNEIKYYAPGVGVIFNDPKLASLHQDSFELVNLIELSPAGLTEASQVVLDMEDHARTVVPDVYADAPVAERVR
jgi:hypothetical protein